MCILIRAIWIIRVQTGHGQHSGLIGHPDMLIACASFSLWRTILQIVKVPTKSTTSYEVLWL